MGKPYSLPLPHPRDLSLLTTELQKKNQDAGKRDFSLVFTTPGETTYFFPSLFFLSFFFFFDLVGMERRVLSYIPSPMIHF
jgi:hypothetical protein